ncbi:MAG: MotA/TolQ/ExbB proton channel family protein [Phycisphaerales bacterium]|nr:MotA/TolQ/ExbB proton channel family protein [Phycisphaerales bacterium]
MDSFVKYFVSTCAHAIDIWVDGGWAMIGIAIIGVIMFAMGVHMHLALRAKGFRSVPERVWRQWITSPKQRRGAIGALLNHVTGARTLRGCRQRFAELEVTAIDPIRRDLRIMRICVSAAPLVGLLGTVTGMLTTFSALSMGSGGDKTMAMISSGISEALITTETGLVIALPGLFLQYHLARQFERYKAFLAHVESVCAQELYRAMKSVRAAA